MTKSKGTINDDLKFTFMVSIECNLLQSERKNGSKCDDDEAGEKKMCK